jgi:hypothetical protein
MNSFRSLVLILLGIFTLTGTVYAEAKVEEQDVGPVGSPQDVQYVVSP